MKLNEYIQSLQDLVAKNPKHGSLKVVCSSDDEGNSFQEVRFAPTLGKFNKNDRDFDDEGKPNAVCIN